MTGKKIWCYEYKFRSKWCLCLCDQLRGQGLTNVSPVLLAVPVVPQDALLIFRTFFVTCMFAISVKMLHYKGITWNLCPITSKGFFSIHPEKVSRPCKIIFFHFCSHLYSRKYFLINSWLIFSAEACLEETSGTARIWLMRLMTAFCGGFGILVMKRSISNKSEYFVTG